jgi:hypothetical protein
VSKYQSTLIFLLLVICKAALAQGQHRINGSVKNADSGEPLVNVTVWVEDISRGTATDLDGTFTLTRIPGSYTLTFSILGYEKQKINVDLTKDITLDISLKEIATEIAEVTVTDNRAEANVNETETGRVTLTREELQKTPYLLGESDPIRMLQLMPGVQTATEGSTGFYVRGGAIDQNLILLDNSIVYNPSHLFGFFSVFNGSLVEQVDLYKGGIPASYGGRLSSFTTVQSRTGDYETLKGEAGIGLVAAHAMVEGPLKKNKGSFLVGARRSYVDLFTDPLRRLFSLEEQINYYFYDVNVNADYNLSSANKLRLRFYHGNDDFQFATKSSFSNNINWGNTTGSLQWLHQFNKNLIGELTTGISLYDMDFGASIGSYGFSVVSDIEDKNISYRLDLFAGKHTVATGVAFTNHGIRPNNVDAHSEDVELDFGTAIRLYADEASVYVNDKWKFSEKLEGNFGLRVSYFAQKGPFTRYIVDESLQILDTITYSKRDIIASYFNPEPRISFRYSINPNSSVKLSFDRAYQSMHMAPLASASLPLDMWVTSSSKVKPQYANQYSAGFYRNLRKQTIESSLVFYYKSMFNQLEYRDGVIIGYSKGFNFDDNFVFGKGTSYGCEMLIKKNSGRLTGSIAYTLSKTTRKFPELNKGKAFPAKYDRLHDVSVLATYELNRRWTIAGVFVYGTGNALNLPVARYVVQGNVVNEYGDRNAFRMPAYHRADVAATYTRKKGSRFESSWIFSVYNVYNRRNPYYIYFESSGDIEEYSLKTDLKQVSLFPVIPSVTYRVKFQ